MSDRFYEKGALLINLCFYFLDGKPRPWIYQFVEKCAKVIEASFDSIYKTQLGDVTIFIQPGGFEVARKLNEHDSFFSYRAQLAVPAIVDGQLLEAEFLRRYNEEAIDTLIQDPLLVPKSFEFGVAPNPDLEFYTGTLPPDGDLPLAELRDLASATQIELLTSVDSEIVYILRNINKKRLREKWSLNILKLSIIGWTFSIEHVIHSPKQIIGAALKVLMEVPDEEISEIFTDEDLGLSPSYNKDTLEYFLFVDYPTKFDNLVCSRVLNMNSIKYGVLDQSELDIALAVSHKMKFFNLFTGRHGLSIENGGWYRYLPYMNRWIASSKELTVKRIMKEVESFFQNLETLLTPDMVRRHIPDDQNIDLHKINENIDKILKRANGIKFWNTIGNALRYQILYDHAESFFNKRIGLLSTRSGVIDVDVNYVAIRQGIPQDFLTMGTNLAILDNKIGWSHPHVLELMDWLEKAFRSKDDSNEEIRDFFIDVVSQSLRTDGALRGGIFLVGPKGRNSKTAVSHLIETAFGSLVSTPPITVYCKRSDPNAPTPVNAMMKSSKVIIFNECESVIIDSSLYKMSTGGDNSHARMLNENGGCGSSNGLQLFLCNQMPRFSSYGHALHDRVFIIVMTSQWIRNCPETEEEQELKHLYPEDRKFSDKLNRLASAFLWVLVERYPNLMGREIMRPAAITKAVDAYWAEYNFVISFTNDCLVKCDGVSIDMRDVYSVFNDWSEIVGITKKYQFNEFLQQIEPHLGSKITKTPESSILEDHDFKPQFKHYVSGNKW